MRKIAAHYIFDGFTFHKYATLILSDSNQIIDIELPKSNTYQEQAGVEFYNGIICPGFINAHCHLELSYLHQQIPEHTELPGFISHIVSLRKSIEPNYETIEKADIQMQTNGIVAVGDIANTIDSFEIKAKSNIYYHTFYEIFDSLMNKKNLFENAAYFYSRNKYRYNISLTPHAPYSCSQLLLARINFHASDNKKPISIHNQEHQSENELFNSKSGDLYEFFKSKGTNFNKFKACNKSSLQVIAPILEDTPHVLFVHNVHTNKEDIDFLKSIRKTNTFTFVLCPLSNLYIGNTLPPLDLFISQDISIAIGTDSLASNHQLSILDELHCLQNSFPQVTLAQLLTFATYNGAKALGIDHNFGSFTKNKQPGVLLLENVDLHNLKLQNNSKVRVLV